MDKMIFTSLSGHKHVDQRVQQLANEITAAGHGVAERELRALAAEALEVGQGEEWARLARRNRGDVGLARNPGCFISALS